MAGPILTCWHSGMLAPFLFAVLFSAFFPVMLADMLWPPLMLYLGFDMPLAFLGTLIMGCVYGEITIVGVRMRLSK